MSTNKENNHNCKCTTCENYNKEIDFCKEKEIENCSQYARTDFAQCDNYLIDKRLVMF